MDDSPIITELPARRSARTLHRPHLPDPPKVHVSNLYPEILALIFGYLEVRDKGRAAQVCQAWRDASYRKSVWRGVEAKLHLPRRANPSLFPSLVRRGIKRVQILSLRRSLRDVVQALPDLESLNLSGCYSVSDGSLAQAFVREAPNLTRLDLSLCKQVTDSSLGRIAQNVKNLEELDLSGCSNLTNTGLLLVDWGLKRLRRLDIRSCWQVSDRGIGHLAGLHRESSDGNPCLEYLGLQDCQLSDEALRHVSSGLKTLTSINLSFCVNISDAGLKYLAKMPSLRELNLRSCDNVSDAGIAYLAEGGSRITSLDVSFCDKIGDQALVSVSQGLFGLRALHMSACQISDEGILRLASTLHDLETLDIGQCTRVTDKGLCAIADSLKNLRRIDLYGCVGISSVGLERITKLPRLSTLNRTLGLALWHDR